ncbi:LytR C-terminal domain-containing protein [Patescibacteria group bacterium]|nr:LytR C-terminal domain-containing protein [Patescibacteria group bacterium]
MDGYFVHLNGTTLKLGMYSGNEQPKYLTEELLPTVVSHSKIIDPQAFCQELSKILATHYGDKLPKLPLYFVLEPELTELFLLTGNKTGADDPLQLEQQIRERLVDEQPEELYFSRYKIAPFIYQFVGIKKPYLEAILTTGTILGLEIGGIIPWGLVLAKTNADLASMFIFPKKDEHTVVFSELTGVSFAEKLAGKLSMEDLRELFWKLSVYTTKKGELNIYTFAKYEHALSSTKPRILEPTELEEDFEEIGLTKQWLDKEPQAINSQANLLNILPLPQVEVAHKTPALIAAGAFCLILLAGLGIQLTIGFDTILSKWTGREQNVLANQDQAPTDLPATPEPSSAPIPQSEIKRADLKIRVENGNGVAGSAGQLQAYLEGFGYQVVSVGNADHTNYTKTTVKLPKEFSDYTTLLTNDLKTNYDVEIQPTDTKPTEYDVLIIVGAN